MIASLALGDYHLAMWVREDERSSSDEEKQKSNNNDPRTLITLNLWETLEIVFESKNFQLYVVFT